MDPPRTVAIWASMAKMQGAVPRTRQQLGKAGLLGDAAGAKAEEKTLQAFEM